MGKKIKKKAQSAHKEKGVSSNTLHSVREPSNPTVETDKERVSVAKERKLCNHIDKGVDLDKISSKIGFGNALKCEDCRDGPARDRKVGKGRGKQGKKKGVGSVDLMLEPKCIWVCLECGHCACGGAVGDLVPQNHALRHARQTRHLCAVQFDNPLLSWCFSCNSVILTEKTEEHSERNDILSEVQELIKRCSSKGAVMDVEDIWFSGGELGKKLENGECLVSDARIYVVRGLVNLGNTCFFNSVMQNLLSMDLLRAYFMNMEQLVGPLTMALKKLFSETSTESDFKSCKNPKALFGCICSKAPQFRGYQQQDSHELLRYLLDGLHTEELGARKPLISSSEVEVASGTTSVPTFVDVIFGGQLSSTICCVECGHSSIVYEPFLDLSLPVPMKKPSSSKKAQVTRPKKTKIPLKEGSKGGKFRERRNNNVASVSTQSAALVSLPSECCKSSCMTASNKPDTKETIPSAVLDTTWLDILGSETLSDNTSSISQNYYISATEDSRSTQVSYNEDVMQSTCEARSLNQDEFPKDDLPLCVQDSEVLLLPYKEEASITEEIVGLQGDSQNRVTAAVEDVSFKDVNATASSVNGWEQTELEFDGLGDLFNEPETVSDTKTEFRTGDLNFQANEDMDLALLAGNSSDSNQDEVDNTNAQVSIDSCLAYFTKPELLSEEHAWHCESCSKILRRQTVEARDGKGQVVRSSKLSKSLKYQASRDEFTPLGNGELTRNEDNANTSGNSSLHMERIDAASANAELKMVNHTDESNHDACEFGNLGNERGLGILYPVSNGLAHSPKVSQGEEDLGTPNHAPEGVSCSSLHDKTSAQVSSGDSYSENSHCDFKDRDILSKVGQGQRSVSHSSVGGNELADSESEDIDSESTKVKRNATKRILISKAPSILTIHLKRFSQDARGRLSKLSGLVSFRDTLDLCPYMGPRSGEMEKCMYRLVGVVEHSGTMRGGHYVAYFKGAMSRGKIEKEGGSSTWYYASDAHVHEVSLTEVLQSEAYILFYEKM
eukprot:TRINITY_DN40204_c0_g1_i2.p1 TRINITY_DN40204_c0_g1~~TRINITY_DN40204_c0_g1_i2.p1  ORF type:complete len:1010 (-),score=211.69 TRINITY_DN40204_c0_g1_i2:505-3534(-)